MKTKAAFVLGTLSILTSTAALAEGTYSKQITVTGKSGGPFSVTATVSPSSPQALFSKGQTMEKCPPGSGGCSPKPAQTADKEQAPQTQQTANSPEGHHQGTNPTDRNITNDDLTTVLGPLFGKKKVQAATAGIDAKAGVDQMTTNPIAGAGQALSAGGELLKNMLGGGGGAPPKPRVMPPPVVDNTPMPPRDFEADKKMAALTNSLRAAEAAVQAWNNAMHDAKSAEEQAKAATNLENAKQNLQNIQRQVDALNR